MSLETLAQTFGEKGFVRQAVLLKSKNGKEYCKALGHPGWREHIQSALGEQLYADLQKELEQFESPDRKLLSKIFGESKPLLPSSEFQPRQYGASPLEIHLENTFDLPTLRHTADMTAKISGIVVNAERTIFTEVHEKTATNDEMIYDMYKDADHIPEKDLTPAELQHLAQDYRHKLSGRIDRLQRFYEMSSPRALLFDELTMVQEALPHLRSLLGNAGDILFTGGENTADIKNVMEKYGEKYKRLMEKYGDAADTIIQDAVPRVIEEGKRVLKDKDSFQTFFGSGSIMKRKIKRNE